MTIKYIAFIEESTGQLIKLKFPQRTVEDEGLMDDGTTRVVHVTEDNLPDGCNNFKYFMENHAYNGSSFVYLGAKPNDYAIWDFSTSAWTWDADLVLRDIRRMRSRKLAASDWTQANDSPLSDADKAAWATYRQALRDITTSLTGTEATTEDVTWPTAP